MHLLHTKLCPPQNTHLEVLIPSVMVFGGGAFGKLGLDDVMRVGSQDGIRVLMRGSETSTLSCSLPSEDTARSWSSASQEEPSPGTCILPFKLPNCDEEMSVLFSHLGCGILLQQPKLKHSLKRPLWCGV